MIKKPLVCFLLLIASISYAYEDDAIRLRKAIARSAEDGTPVILENREYRLFSQIVLPSSVTIQGNGARVSAWNWAGNKGGPFVIADGATNVTLQGLRITAFNCSWAIQASSCSQIAILDCDFDGPIYKGYFIDFNGASSRVRIERSKFADSQTAVRFRGAVSDAIVRDCEVTDWLNYGILIEGTAEAGPMVRIDGCYLHSPKAGVGGARQMIVATNPKKVANIRNLVITNTRCKGPGGYYDRTSETSTATGDQIKISYCVDFLLSESVSTGSGENAATIELNSSRGVASANIFAEADGNGLQVGSRNNRPEPDVTDILVTGNLSIDNGVGTDPAAKKTMANFYSQDAARVTYTGNQSIDTRTPRLIWAGFNVAECESVSIPQNANTIHLGLLKGGQDIAVYASTLTKPPVVFQSAGTK